SGAPQGPASQSRTVPSPLAEASCRPSGRNATEVTASVCPRSASSSLPVAASQSRTVRSVPPEAVRRPSGLKATPQPSPPLPAQAPPLLPGDRLPALPRPPRLGGHGQVSTVAADRPPSRRF